MSLGDLNDVLFSQDERTEIGYGGHNDFVSKLIEKAKANNEGAVKTPPRPIRNPGGRLAMLRKPRKDSREIELALRALKNPVRRVDSPGPVTRSQTAESSTPTRNSNSKPSLDDSTDAIFGTLPPTPNLERTQKNFTPRNSRVVSFRRSEMSTSTPDSNSKQSTRPKNRSLGRAPSCSSLGLDKSTGSAGYRCAGGRDDTDHDEDDSLDEDILNEATQRAELHALSQRLLKPASPQTTLLKDRSNETPKTAGRVRPMLASKDLSAEPEKKSGDFKDKLRSSQTPKKGSHTNRAQASQSVKNSSKAAKCTAEEIQKKKEAALLRRRLRMSVK